MSHLDDLLSAHLDGELTIDEEGRVKAHLAGCNECRVELNAVTKARNLMRALPLLEPPPGLLPAAEAAPVRRSWLAAPSWTGAVAAAVVVVVAVGGFLVLRDDGSETVAMATVPRSVTGVAAEVPAGDPEMSSQERRGVIEATAEDMGMDTFNDPEGPSGFVHHGDPVAVLAGVFDEMVSEEEMSQGLQQMYEDELVFGIVGGEVVFYCDHSWYRLWTLGDGYDPMDAAMDFKAALGCPSG